MTERYIEAAINGVEGSNEAYFFLGNQFVTYNWVADRASDGVRPASEWGLPTAFTPSPAAGTGPEAAGLDSAVKGRAAFATKAYFFKNSQYFRCVFSPRGPDGPDALDLAAWKFLGPSFATGIDAAFNGRGSRDGKGYFFRGDLYNRYDWKKDAPDAQDPNGQTYPRPISNMVGMPADFASGVDAAVDGEGKFSGVGYLFRLQSYLRFNWSPPGGGEPRVDGPSALIQDKWPGLVELLLAGAAKSKALVWIAAGHDRLSRLLSGSLSPPEAATLNEALRVHFHIDPAAPIASKAAFLAQINNNFALMTGALNESATKFRFRTDSEANGDLVNGSGFQAYTFFNGSMNFTRRFVAVRRLGRAAIVVHEAVHAVDEKSAVLDVPEWFVTDGEADRLHLARQGDRPDIPIRYDRLTTNDAIHNSSSYAAFSQHVATGTDFASAMSIRDLNSSTGFVRSSGE
jgi:hypothetical protein